MADTKSKTYPFSEPDLKFEQEISDAIKKLPLETRIQVIALNHYLLSKKQSDTETEAKGNEVYKKYNKLQEPGLTTMNEIVSGKRAPTEEEVAVAKEHLNTEETAKITESLTAEAIPDYWFKVLTSCAKFEGEIFETDHELLKKITHIEHIPEQEGEDFTFKFHFAPNDYFENDVLSVKFVMIDDTEPAKTEGTDIKWKEGKDITKKTISKKQKNKKTGKTRTVEKTVDADSFFNFFKSTEGSDDKEGGDDDDEEGGEEGRLEISYDIAINLQDEIISHHLEYYLGVRTGLEDEMGHGLGDIDEEDEDDEDDDDEEEGGHKHSKHCSHGHKGKAPKGSSGPTAGGAEAKPECKQQ